jgi:hypothetical protein
MGGTESLAEPLEMDPRNIYGLAYDRSGMGIPDTTYLKLKNTINEWMQQP